MAMFREHKVFTVDPKVNYANISPGAKARRLVTQNIHCDRSSVFTASNPVLTNVRAQVVMISAPLTCLKSKPAPVLESLTILSRRFLRPMSPDFQIRHPAPLGLQSAAVGQLNISIHNEEFQ
jgi:hypothetical protein